MKLSTKTTLYYVTIGFPLLIVAIFLSYFFIKQELKDGIDETLEREFTQAKVLSVYASPEKPVYLGVDSLSYIKLDLKKNNYNFFSDIIIKNELDDEWINYRVLKRSFEQNAHHYLICISKATYEEEELLEGLFVSFFIIITFIVLAFIIVQWIVSRVLWKPFYNTLKILKEYDVKRHQTKSFDHVNTLEFQQLNVVLTQMTNKLAQDYLQQKEFTENASHEMQTPLAIIKSQVGLIMQSPLLSEVEMNQLQEIENTTKKMSALNKALILLSKIENKQFESIETIHLNELLNKITAQYRELFELKNITLVIEHHDSTQLKMNAALAEILFSNLFRNAIKHNCIDGKIHIDVFKNRFIISNSGEPLTINSDDLFVRFKKNDASNDSLGLGLSIVKSICHSYQFTIEYSYSNQLHTFNLTL